ncbi:MAG TPA: OmpA family protein [Crocinitomicaceae bacterium]|nr:OmpA family protein [Crocinitomicaceae bacterium]
MYRQILLVFFLVATLQTSYAQEVYSFKYFYDFNQKTPIKRNYNDTLWVQSSLHKIDKIVITANSDTVGYEKGNLQIGQQRYEILVELLKQELNPLPPIAFINEGSKLQRQLKLTNENARFLQVDVYYSDVEIENIEQSPIKSIECFQAQQSTEKAPENYKGQTLVLSILFWGDKNKYLGNPQGNLQKIYDIYTAQPELKLLISGHSCCGNKVGLSKRRARRVCRDLRKMGIPRKSISYIGYGNQRPLVEETNDAARQKNRRVEVEFY